MQISHFPQILKSKNGAVSVDSNILKHFHFQNVGVTCFFADPDSTCQYRLRYCRERALQSFRFHSHLVNLSDLPSFQVGRRSRSASSRRSARCRRTAAWRRSWAGPGRRCRRRRPSWRARVSCQRVSSTMQRRRSIWSRRCSTSLTQHTGSVDESSCCSSVRFDCGRNLCGDCFSSVMSLQYFGVLRRCFLFNGFLIWPSSTKQGLLYIFMGSGDE